MYKTTKTKLLNILFAASLILIAIQAQLAYSDSDTISSIKIVGNTRTERSTILSYAHLKEGDQYSKQKADQSIKSLYSTGFFSKIKINFADKKMTISVIENPIINKVDFSGNKALKTDVLSKELVSKTRSFFSKSKLNNDVNRLLNIYNKSGRFSTKIVPQIATLPQNRVNILFKIKEGKKSTIKKVIFVGNKRFSENVLKSEIMSKEDRIYNIFRANYYDEDIVEYDKVLLTKFYHSKGYVDFKVISATADIVSKNNGFYLTYSIEEGDKYDFGNTKINNHISAVNTKEILKLIEFKKGEIFNSNLVDKSTQDIIKYLAVNGYPFVDVQAGYRIDNKNKLVNINYVISKAQKVYIGRVNIRGNLKTYDNVIRKELKLSEGDPYNSFLITNSEQRLKNLDYFEKVKINVEKTNSADTVDLDVVVEEKSTAAINISAGFSSSDGPLGMLGFTESNLFGQGKKFSMNIQKSASSLSSGLALTQPNFMQSNIAVGFSLQNSSKNHNTSQFGSTSDSTPYEIKHTSASVFMNYNITDDLFHSANYSISKDSIGRVDPASATIFIEQTGKNIVSSVGHNLVYNKTDSTVSPTTGYALNFTQMLAGIGGDSQFIKNIMECSYYYPINDDLVLKLAASAGNIKGLGKDIRVSENFHLGDYSLRGFDYSGAGPRDKGTNKDYLGGTTYYTGTVETKFPVPGLAKDSDVSGSIFSDFGSVWGVDIPNSSSYSRSSFHNDKSIRVSAGVGLIWLTKMGPLRIDFAKALKKQDYDMTRSLLFSFSTLF